MQNYFDFPDNRKFSSLITSVQFSSRGTAYLEAGQSVSTDIGFPQVSDLLESSTQNQRQKVLPIILRAVGYLLYLNLTE